MTIDQDIENRVWAMFQRLLSGYIDRTQFDNYITDEVELILYNRG